MRKSIGSILCAAALVLVMPAGVQAVAIINSSTNVQIVAPPVSAASGDLESNNFFSVFEEQTTIIGNQSVQTVTVGESRNSNTGGTVSGLVTSFFVHFDKVGTGSGERELNDAFLEFDGTIVGIIWENSELKATDKTLGLAGTDYTPALVRAYEGGTVLFYRFEPRRFFSCVDRPQCRQFPGVDRCARTWSNCDIRAQPRLHGIVATSPFDLELRRGIPFGRRPRGFRDQSIPIWRDGLANRSTSAGHFSRQAAVGPNASGCNRPSFQKSVPSTVTV